MLPAIWGLASDFLLHFSQLCEGPITVCDWQQALELKVNQVPRLKNVVLGVYVGIYCKSSHTQFNTTTIYLRISEMPTHVRVPQLKERNIVVYHSQAGKTYDLMWIYAHLPVNSKGRNVQGPQPEVGATFDHNNSHRSDKIRSIF